MSGLSKQEAYDWLRARIRPLGLDHTGRESACQAALKRWSPEVSPDGWRRWVDSCLQRAKHESAEKPSSVLIAALREDPGDALEPSPPPAHRPGQPRAEDDARRAQEREAERDLQRQPKPPLSLVLPLCRERGISGREAWDLIDAEWRRQGCPWSEDFDPQPLEVSA